MKKYILHYIIFIVCNINLAYASTLGDADIKGSYYVDRDPHYFLNIKTYNWIPRGEAINVTYTMGEYKLSKIEVSRPEDGVKLLLVNNDNYVFTTDDTTKTVSLKVWFTKNGETFEYLQRFLLRSDFYQFYDEVLSKVNYTDQIEAKDEYATVSAYNGSLYVNKNTRGVTPLRITSNDRYDIYEGTTGMLKKKGVLDQNTNQVDVSTFKNGMYIVRIFSGNISKSYKVNIRN